MFVRRKTVFSNGVLCCAVRRCPLQVAADPNTLYPILIDSPAVTTLANLLGHDNTDIAVEVMDLLQELTDAGGAPTQQHLMPPDTCVWRRP
jgi:hypothetical protein